MKKLPKYLDIQNTALYNNVVKYFYMLFLNIYMKQIAKKIPNVSQISTSFL